MSHEGPVYDRDHVQSEETDRSENVNKCAAVQTRAMKQKELKPPKPLKVSSINGLEIGPEQLIEQQRSDETCEMAQQQLSKVQDRKQKYYNRHAKSRYLSVVIKAYANIQIRLEVSRKMTIYIGNHNSG